MSTPLDIHAGVNKIISRDGACVFSVGSSYPADATTGYDKGAIHIDNSNAKVYVNQGTRTSSNFDEVTGIA